MQCPSCYPVHRSSGRNTCRHIVIFPFCRVCELVGVARAVRGADVVVAIGSVAAALWLFAVVGHFLEVEAGVRISGSV